MRLLHLSRSLRPEEKESLEDKNGNTVLSLEGEVGLSEGSEREIIPKINYDISTKGYKAKLPEQSGFGTESKQNRLFRRLV
jgi:hypothetical protein